MALVAFTWSCNCHFHSSQNLFILQNRNSEYSRSIHFSSLIHFSFPPAPCCFCEFSSLKVLHRRTIQYFIQCYSQGSWLYHVSECPFFKTKEYSIDDYSTLSSSIHSSMDTCHGNFLLIWILLLWNWTCKRFRFLAFSSLQDIPITGMAESYGNSISIGATLFHVAQGSEFSTSSPLVIFRHTPLC